MPHPPRADSAPAASGPVWYAAQPSRRARQIVADLFAVLWCVVAAQGGRLLHDAVMRLGAPVVSLQEGTQAVEDQLNRLSARVADVPLVGAQLREALTTAGSSSGDARQVTADFLDSLARLALWVGWLSALAVAAVVVVPWLVVRLRFVRQVADVRRALGAGNALELLALRALTTRPMRDLLSVDVDPAGAWRRGDPVATRALAALELRDAGFPVAHRG